MIESDLKKGSLYKNIKTGDIYRIFYFATHSESLDTLVIYQKANGTNASKECWARPRHLFLVKFTLPNTCSVCLGFGYLSICDNIFTNMMNKCSDCEGVGYV